MLQEVVQFSFGFRKFLNCSIDWVGPFFPLVVEHAVDFSFPSQTIVGCHRLSLQFFVRGLHFSFKSLDQFRLGTVCGVSFLLRLFFCVFPFQVRFLRDWIIVSSWMIFSWWPWIAWFLRFTVAVLGFAGWTVQIIRWVFVSWWWLLRRYFGWKISHFPLSSSDIISKFNCCWKDIIFN